MATGTPKSRSSARVQSTTRSDISGLSHLSLEYLGKRPVAEILKTNPVDSELLWDGSAVTSANESNRLYYADNLGAMASLLKDETVAGKVRLVYIDPPFATLSAFHSRSLEHAYEDTLGGPDFVEFLRERLILLRELLAADGSIYLHLDEKMAFQMKVVMDEIFGPENFRNFITRKKCNPKNYTRKSYGNISDYILFYSKSENYVWNRPTEAWTLERAKEYHYVEAGTGRRFMKVPVHAPGVRRGETGKPWRGMLPPPGKHWQFAPAKLDEFDSKGEIYWSPNGNPRRKVYFDENQGIGVQDIWLDFRDAHNQNICITGYPTEKNPELLRRIIEASSRPGDLVLDCFAGSGTTMAMAALLARRWIGVDNSPEAIKTILRRFRKGTEPMGDFVSQRNGDDERHGKKSKAIPGLFDSLDLPLVKEETVQKHVPIVDFKLLSASGYSREIKGTVDEWRSYFPGVKKNNIVTTGLQQPKEFRQPSSH